MCGEYKLRIVAKLGDCPHCKAQPSFEFDGSMLEVVCSSCGDLSYSVQLCDMFTKDDLLQGASYGDPQEKHFLLAEQELIKLWNEASNSCSDKCQEVLTRYIVNTALSFSKTFSKDVAREMIVDAGISMENELDARIISEIGDDAIAMVLSFYE